jgi:hypothetical protein
MRKHVIGSFDPHVADREQNWLGVERIAEVEVTSEHPEYPVESVFETASSSGWRAAGPGPQAIRIAFDTPVDIRRIRLTFNETATQRTQEFVLTWSADRETFQEIVRQQWTFSPDGSTQESEDYRVDLKGVSKLQIEIRPDLDFGSKAIASLQQWHLA